MKKQYEIWNSSSKQILVIDDTKRRVNQHIQPTLHPSLGVKVQLRIELCFFFFSVEEEDDNKQKQSFCHILNFPIPRGDHEPIGIDPYRIKACFTNQRHFHNNV